MNRYNISIDKSVFMYTSYLGRVSTLPTLDKVDFVENIITQHTSSFSSTALGKNYVIMYS